LKSRHALEKVSACVERWQSGLTRTPGKREWA
jgi:hypothetical protein